MFKKMYIDKAIIDLSNILKMSKEYVYVEQNKMAVGVEAC